MGAKTLKKIIERQADLTVCCPKRKSRRIVVKKNCAEFNFVNNQITTKICKYCEQVISPCGIYFIRCSY